MPLKDLQGQDRAVGQLRAALHRGRIPHAYLISGVVESDLREVGQRFAEALLCPVNAEGCGECPSCTRATRGLHPDFLGATLESGAKEVKVEAVRELCAALQLKPVEAGRKIGLIPEADRLSTAAQNALLKTLEEPPPGTVQIQEARSEDRLLPTIRSRCVRLRLGTLPEAQLLERLRKLDSAAPGDLELVARQARGSMARAEELLSRSGGGFKARRDQILGHLASLLRDHGRAGGASAALELAETAAEGRERAVELLEVLASSLRDILLVRGGADSRWLLGADRAEALASLAKARSTAQLLAGLDDLAEASLALEGNSSPRLQVEAAALRLTGLA